MNFVMNNLTHITRWRHNLCSSPFYFACYKTALTADMVLLVMKTVAIVPTLMYVTKEVVTVLMGALLDIKGLNVKKV